jgi:very-short-patch-repair endonuclease
MRKRLPKIVKYTARRLRKEQTEAEALLWEELKGRKICGVKFLRQHPITFEYNGKKRFIVADYYCHKAKLIIELDGGIHEKTKDYDNARDNLVKSLGFNILRIQNNDVKNNLLETITRVNNIMTGELFQVEKD